MRVEIHPLKKERVPDFLRLHCEENGASWCRCVAWWVPTWEGWGERTSGENLALRRELFARGEYDGMLLYAEGEPAGWCQCGPRDRLEKLGRQFDRAPDAGVWAVSCFLVAPRWRKQGVARRLLDAVIEEARRRGARSVEAYPRRGDSLPDDDAWTGPESLFRAAGFEEIAGDEGRLVLAITLSE